MPAHHSSQDCCIQSPWPHSRPLSTHSANGDFWALIGKSDLVSCRITAPLSWVLVCTRFCFCPPRVCFPSPVEVLWSNRTGLSTSWEMPSWMKHKLESRLPGEMSTTLDQTDATLMAESKEELKSFLMNMKEEGKKSWLKTQHSEN